MRINAAIKEYIEHLRKIGKTENTIMAYSSDLAQFEKFLQEHNISTLKQITPEIIEKYKKHLQEKLKLGASTISRKIHALKVFFKYVISKGYILINPMQNITVERVEVDGPPRYLTKLEYMALREAARKDPRLFAMVEVMLQTGIRVGELSRLRLGDLRHTAKGMPYLYIMPYGSHPERVVPLPKSAYEALQTYIQKVRNKIHKDDSKDAPLFVTKSGKHMPVRNIRDLIKKLYKEVGINDATVNDLRNTFIMHHLKKGANPALIARIVGHKHISTIERFIKHSHPKEQLGSLNINQL